MDARCFEPDEVETRFGFGVLSAVGKEGRGVVDFFFFFIWRDGLWQVGLCWHVGMLVRMCVMQVGYIVVVFARPFANV